MQFWCSAQGIPWTWTWRPYLGVWLLVGALAVLYLRWHRRADAPATPAARRIARWRRWAAAGGLVSLWLLLDWPIGTLGGGYLESVHAVQFIGLAFVVPPLLVLGLPAGWEARRRPPTRAMLESLTRPLPAILGFNLVILLTHLPPLVDALMVSQLGSLAMDAGWILGGVAFWWSLLRGWPVRLGAAARLAYLLAGVTLHMGVGMSFVVAEQPLYRVYELAPRVAHIDPLDDQGRAGGIMMTGDVVLGLGGIAVLLALWRREELEQERREHA
jgi:cytochrome c oxidase assembly factor CtaG